MITHALTFEYSYANNWEGSPSPDATGGTISLFENEEDAQDALEKERDDGHWGDFSDADSNDGWSSEGYILAVTSMKVTPSSKG